MSIVNINIIIQSILLRNIKAWEKVRYREQIKKAWTLNPPFTLEEEINHETEDYRI